jgi:predicted RNase H-like HicB family nuclease
VWTTERGTLYFLACEGVAVSATASSHITLTFKIHEEDHQYVGRCEELGISSCAKTIDTAFKRVVEATTLYLNTLESVGEAERVLAEAGVEVRPGEPESRSVPICTSTENEFVTVRSARLPKYAFA